MNYWVNLLKLAVRASFVQLLEGHSSSSRGTAPPSSESEECSSDFCCFYVTTWVQKTISLHIISAISSEVVFKLVLNILITTKRQVEKKSPFLWIVFLWFRISKLGIRLNGDVGKITVLFLYSCQSCSKHRIKEQYTGLALSSHPIQVLLWRDYSIAPLEPPFKHWWYFT